MIKKLYQIQSKGVLVSQTHPRMVAAMSTSQRKVLLGMGATKSATSWLYSTLKMHPQCGLKDVKELHYFDSVALKHRALYIADLHILKEKLRKKLKSENINSENRKILRCRVKEINRLVYLLNSQSICHHEYLNFLYDGSRTKRIVGDITPGYSILPKNIISDIVTGIPDSHFIFQMRDPLERLWSHVRMNAVRTSNSGENIRDRSERMLMNVIGNTPDTRDIRIRGDYISIIKKILETIPEDRRYICIAEEILSQDGILDLYNFLGIDYLEPKISNIEHKGEDLTLSSELRVAAYNYLRPQYDFVFSYFGRVPRGWRTDSIAPGLSETFS